MYYYAFWGVTIVKNEKYEKILYTGTAVSALF